MALNSLFCADVPLSNYPLTHATTAIDLLTARSPLATGRQNCFEHLLWQVMRIECHPP